MMTTQQKTAGILADHDGSTLGTGTAPYLQEYAQAAAVSSPSHNGNGHHAPAELAERKIWLLWKSEQVKGRLTKVPVQSLITPLKEFPCPLD